MPKNKHVDIAEPANEKKQRRLEKNRESARECRKRKKDKILNLHQQLAKLETDNLQLRLQLQYNPNSAAASSSEASPSTEPFSSPSFSLEEMINKGASEHEIQSAIKELQERYADYGRDRRSAFSFHLTQLKRCLLPTQTTRTMLWLMRCAVQYLSPEGEIKYNPAEYISPPADIIELLASLLATLKPTREQRKQLVSLTSIYSGAPQTVDFSDEIIQRLSVLVTDKNELLDAEMSNISQILSPLQIAKFILWIQQNPATMQMLEALWPHLTANL